jgi:hypothetical protein
MQINVPHSEYGECSYFMPVDMQKWLVERNLMGHYCGSVSSGDGYTSGVTNRESSYTVKGIKKEDGLVFKIMFPKCKVHIFEVG